MKSLSRIAGINLIILALYTIVIHVSFKVGTKSDAVLGILLFSIIPIALHVAINVIVAVVFFIKKNNPLGKSFLFSSLLVLIIGFSTCWGSAFIAG